MHSPKNSHLEVVNRSLRYLKLSFEKGILFKKNKELNLEVYTNANRLRSIINQRSTPGYCTFLGGYLVTWRSKKKGVVARSSAKAKFWIIAQ